MPWYFSYGRAANSIFCGTCSALQFYWVVEAEDRYKRSLLWKPSVAVITEHKLMFAQMGASHIEYTFKVNGKEYTGNRFRSGAMYGEEHLRNPALLGVGTELVIYYDEKDPTNNAVKITTDRTTQGMFLANAVLAAILSYRLVRCETVVPWGIYRAFGMNRRVAENTGLRAWGTQPPVGGKKP
eukprot:PhF_6_TR4798/c0_g1_i1/m.6617